MKKTWKIVSIVVFLTASIESNCQVDKGHLELVWSDEFEVNGAPDSAKWSYRVGDGCDSGICGWGNRELQYYTDKSKNVRVEEGHLIIEAHKESMGGKNYTSTRMISQNKGDWKYGRIEVKAKLPNGVGTWPAIWMKSTDNSYGGWPRSGEVDIMEHVGFDPGTIHGTIHTQAYNHLTRTQKGGEISIGMATSEFHVYAVEWFHDRINFYVNDSHYFSFKNENQTWEEWPFDKRFFLIMNIAVGGNLGGKKGVDDSIFPQRMEIDYVRVYKIAHPDN